MSKTVSFTIDGKECTAQEGTFLVQAAKENGVYIPTLCNYEGAKPKGSCRICNVKVNGRPMTACTTPVMDKMEIENNTAELNEFRKSIVELLFATGNHFCPACEKSGNCELQALGYRYSMMVPRFPYVFPKKTPDAKSKHIIIDHDRCILCKRCVRTQTDAEGKRIFAVSKRGFESRIQIDYTAEAKMTAEEATAAMDVCPVGAIIKKERGYYSPVGTRKYDSEMIGTDIK